MKTDKNKQLKANLHLKQGESKMVGIWEIENLLNQLFSIYYKDILLREVICHLSEGIDPRNIVIFSNDINPSNLFKEIATLDFSPKSEIFLNGDTATFFYELGLPFSVLPSDGVNTLRYIEEVFFGLNSYIWHTRRDNQGFKNRKLSCAIDKLVSEDVDVALSYLKDTAKALLEANNEKQMKLIEQRINKEIDRYKNDYESIGNTKIIDINKSIISSGIKYSDINKETYLKFNYNRFCDIFVSRSIPLVAIYNPENKSFKFCSLYVFDKIENPDFLDLKNYSHNSPVIMELLGNIDTILSLIINLCAAGYYITNVIEDRLKRVDLNDLFAFSDEISNEEKLNINLFYEGIKDMGYTKKEINSKIQNLYLNERLTSIYKECVKKFTAQMNAINMKVDLSKKIKIYSAQ